ncbi:hypothetical protein DYB32_005764, partial [Aphanomyces invadans]
NEEITTTLSHLVDHGNYDAVRHRASFSLVLRSDNVQDEFVPPHRTIRTKCHAKNSVQMKWARTTGPKTILLVKKPNELDVTSAMREVASWLMHEKGIRVFLEPKVHVEEKLAGTFTWSDDQDWQHKIDLVVSFGGDGTVLWVSNLFKTNVPPVFSFAMGSLGFLTPFEFSRADRSGGYEGPHYKGVTVSFDGKHPVKLFRDDALEVRVSSFPLPSVCNLNENEDWFKSVKNNLYWNQRKEMKPLHETAV